MDTKLIFVFLGFLISFATSFTGFENKAFLESGNKGEQFEYYKDDLTRIGEILNDVSPAWELSFLEYAENRRILAEINKKRKRSNTESLKSTRGTNKKTQSQPDPRNIWFGPRLGRSSNKQTGSHERMYQHYYFN